MYGYYPSKCAVSGQGVKRRSYECKCFEIGFNDDIADY